MTKHLPMLSVLIAMAAVFVAQNRGLFTAEQAQALIAMLGIGGTVGVKPIVGGRS